MLIQLFSSQPKMLLNKNALEMDDFDWVMKKQPVIAQNTPSVLFKKVKPQEVQMPRILLCKFKAKGDYTKDAKI